MGFTVQKLLGPAAPADRATHPVQRAGEEDPIRVGQLRRAGPVGHERPRYGNPVRDVRDGQVDLTHPGMQTGECVDVLRVRQRSGRRRFVVGPQGDHVVAPHEDLGGLQRSHRAPDLGQPPSDIHLKLGALVRCRRDPGEHGAGLQPQGEGVRVVQDDTIVGGQAEP